MTATEAGALTVVPETAGSRPRGLRHRDPAPGRTFPFEWEHEGDAASVLYCPGRRAVKHAVAGFVSARGGYTSGMDRALAAREYASHLTDADLRLLAPAGPGDASWLRGDPAALLRLLEDPGTFGTVLGEGRATGWARGRADGRSRRRRS